MNVEQTLGGRVRELRKEKGMTQSELADKADITAPFVSDIENDKRNVSSSVLYQLAEALDCSLDYLMTGKGGREEEPRSREIPPELEAAAEEDNWTYSDAVALLEAKQMVLARRGGRRGGERRDVEELTREDWKDLYASLIES